MIEDKLSNSLLNMGYLRVESNVPGIYFFHQNKDDNLILVSVMHIIQGNEITLEQYEHILEQIKENFMKANPIKIRHLSLLLTKFPERIKPFCFSTKGDSHWIIDLNINRLIIYETQVNEYDGLERTIDQLLAEEPLQGQGDYEVTDRGFRPRRNASSIMQFTLFNSIIIIINCVIHVLFHYSQVFGGRDPIYYRGALSWYPVVEKMEYYRILTSMFLHADWEHLLNNMLVLFFVGVYLERIAGKIKYLLLYFGAGIIAGLASISYNMWQYNNAEYSHPVYSIGASGAIFGVVGAMLYIILINRGRIEGISRRQIVMFAGVSLLGGIGNVQIDMAGHVGGFIAGLLLAALLYRRQKSKS